MSRPHTTLRNAVGLRATAWLLVVVVSTMPALGAACRDCAFELCDPAPGVSVGTDQATDESATTANEASVPPCHAAAETVVDAAADESATSAPPSPAEAPAMSCCLDGDAPPMARDALPSSVSTGIEAAFELPRVAGGLAPATAEPRDGLGDAPRPPRALRPLFTLHASLLI